MLKILRKKVDRLDAKLLRILRKRCSLASEIGILKQKKNEEILDPDREKEVMDRILLLAEKNGLRKGFVEELYDLIMSESRKLQG